MPKHLRCLLKVPHLCISSSYKKQKHQPCTFHMGKSINLYQWLYMDNKIYIHIMNTIFNLNVCGLFYVTTPFLILIVAILIMYSFLLSFKLKLWLWSDVWKLHLTVPQLLSLLTYRWNPLGWQCSHHSLSLVPHLQSLKLMLSVSSVFASTQPPAYSKIYLEKLTSLSFLIPGNVKATLYRKTNLMPTNQKPLLEWGWPCRRNT